MPKLADIGVDELVKTMNEQGIEELECEYIDDGESGQAFVRRIRLRSGLSSALTRLVELTSNTLGSMAQTILQGFERALNKGIDEGETR